MLGVFLKTCLAMLAALGVCLARAAAILAEKKNILFETQIWKHVDPQLWIPWWVNPYAGVAYD